ncbi:bacillithiol system redox-active protein YtxJ [Paenibacillus sp. IB182496]|uniref:Bacillithiol system redox-active protein YtxJ n=2 Tax=Paenibacillus sabuli TaxID=2772509 RepID=A0A927BTV7_9BACL|nr:bacillithiol system redox-active protein YtxJ [Paenibacillus sabuli]
MTLQTLETTEQWDAALAASSERPLLVFKHSTRCSVSAGAHDELTTFLSDVKSPAFDAVLVNVVEDRPVSNRIEEQLEVKHASPQALLVEAGNVTWHTSHWHITYAALEEKLRQHCEM